MILNDERHALSMNDLKVSLFDMQTSQVIGTHTQENEDISAFAISPNQEIFATANKNFLIRIYKMPQRLQDDETGQLLYSGKEFETMECIKTFKTPN